jgi:DNA-binding Lrp family transcriptional regulator
MVDDFDILNEMKRQRRDKFVVTATDLSEQLPITRQSVGVRLRELCDEDRVRRRKVGGNAVVYYLPEWEEALQETIDSHELSV